MKLTDLEIWLQWWTEANGRNTGMFLGEYFAFAVGAILGYAISFW